MNNKEYYWTFRAQGGYFGLDMLHYLLTKYIYVNLAEGFDPLVCRVSTITDTHETL